MKSHILNLDTFDIDHNFWEQNPQIKFILPFSDLYDKDKSKNKDKSSKVMWSMFLLNDPTDKNKFFRMNTEQRIEEIKSNYLKDDSFDFNEYKDLSEAYQNLILTKKQKGYLHIWNKWEEREKFLNSLEYDLDTVELLDKLLANTEKLLASLTRAEEEMIKEELEQGLAGKAKKSAIEDL